MEEMEPGQPIEFPLAKPLPPIGSKSANAEKSQNSETDKSQSIADDDDNKSTTSTGGTDKGADGSSKPRAIRGFRPEPLTDEEMEKQKEGRSVSFSDKLPLVSFKKKAYDGREILYVTLDTQTDWEWVEKNEIMASMQIGPDKTSSPDIKVTSPKPGSKAEGREEKASPSPALNMPYSDEYGIPILDLSSDTDDSSDEEVSHKKIKDERAFMPSIGPPNILQYQRESEKQEIPVKDPASRILGDDYEKDDSGVPYGMFSGNCEFCNKPIKPFPTMEEQLSMPPETLYCCNDYREFVEFVLSTSKELEEQENKQKLMIDIKPHEHVGSKQERNAAKEKAVQRMRERELQRRQQEASGMQNSFFASPSKMVFMKIPGGLGNVTMKDLFVARQMKTINYQLSSQKCLDEGWTVRAPSPFFDDLGDDVFTPEPLNPAMLADGKLRDRPLIEKFYESGQKFITMFPDGTGNVFYPSGNLAILISSVKLGQYNYTIHHDYKLSGVAACFEPNGYGYCYFPNGDIRLYIDQYGGLELDNVGAKRRKWSWKDQLTHVHAPPFQPICIGLNRHMGVRVMSQDNIALTFSASKRSCRFNMGSRLRLVAPENAPLKEVDEEQIFLEEKKNTVEMLLNKVANLLKFPNNPKLDKMLPPLHVTSNQVKTERLKKDRQEYLSQRAARDKKQSSISVDC